MEMPINVGDVDQMQAMNDDPNYQEANRVFAVCIFKKYTQLVEAGFDVEQALYMVTQQGISWDMKGSDDYDPA